MTLPASLTMPDGTSYLPKVNVPSVYWRVSHDPTPLWRVMLPEVYRISPAHHVILTKEIQFLWRAMNPELSLSQMTALMGNTLAFTNGTGVPGHANHLTGTELNKTDPRFDQARFCGGTILKERYVKDGKLYFEYIDTREPLPMPHEVMNRPWLWFEAVNIAQADGKPVIRPLKGNWGKPVYVPILASMDVYYPVELCTKLDPGAAVLPSPYRYP